MKNNSEYQPKVSVIVPAFNAERYLERTLRSVIAQDMSDLELIVVDDGSTDSTEEIIWKVASEEPRMMVRRQENAGVSAARNTGIELSSGQYLAFLDSDDTWNKDNLRSKLEKIEGSDFGLVHSDAQVIDAEDKPTGTSMQGREGDLLEDYLFWKGTCVPGPSSVLIPKTVLDDIGIFDPQLSTAADMDLFIRIASRYPIGRVARTTWSYRVHDLNMHRNITAMETDLLRILEKGDQSGIYRDSSFRRRAYATAYRILGKSWAGDGRNWVRGTKFLLRSVLRQPSQLPHIFRSGS